MILRDDQICLLPIPFYSRCEVEGHSEAFPFWFKQGANPNLPQPLILYEVPTLSASLSHSDVLASLTVATCDDAGYFGEGEERGRRGRKREGESGGGGETVGHSQGKAESGKRGAELKT